MVPRSLKAAAVVLALVVLGACSSDDDSAGPDRTEPPPATADDAVARAGELGCEQGSDVDTDPETGMPTGDQIFEWIEDLTSFGARLPGHDSILEAEAYLECQFEEAGLSEVGFEEVTTWLWELETGELEVDGEDVEAFAAYHSFVTLDEPSEFSTGPDGLTAPLVDVGDGTEIDPEEIEGKVVLFDLRFAIPSGALLLTSDFLWDPDLSLLDRPETATQANPYITNITDVLEQAIDGGAVGFVGVLADYFDSDRYFNEYYRRLEFTIPGFWVSPLEGEALRERISGSDEPDATLTMEGRRTETTARSLMGVLPGSSDETIQVQSHHDATWDGGVQDASGVAEVLALAHYYGAQEDNERDKTLLFSTFSSHWSGYQAHTDFVERYVEDPDSPYDIVANVTIEHIARHALVDPDTRELEVFDEAEPRGILNNVSVELVEVIAGAVAEHDMVRTVVMRTDAIGMPTDASFVYGAGVPTVSLISGPIYLYDEADTAEMVARDQLEPVALVFATIIDAMDAMSAAEIEGGGSLGGMSSREFDEQMGGQLGEALDALPEDFLG